jgi:hypothetical protein
LHQSRPLIINPAGNISIDSIESYKKMLVKRISALDKGLFKTHN